MGTPRMRGARRARFFFAAGLISAGILGVACGAAEPDEGVGASAAALTMCSGSTLP